MAKKSAAAEFNMSEAIREILSAKPSLSSKEVADAIVAKYPTAIINKNSFGVAFYTMRNAVWEIQGKEIGAGFVRLLRTRCGRILSSIVLIVSIS